MGRKKLLFLSGLLGLVLCLGAGPVLAQGRPGYRVDGAYSSSANELTVTVSLEQVDAVIGRFALDFDETKLDLVGAGRLADAVSPSGQIVLNQDGFSDAALVSQAAGRVMFAWYAAGNSVNATEEPVELAVVRFALQPGVTTRDFDWDTLRLLDPVSNSETDWTSGAHIRDRELTDYRYNAVGSAACGISFQYPNSDVQPINARKVTLTIRDADGKPLAAQALLDGNPYPADDNGKITAYLTDGTYSCRISMAGYGDSIESLEVSGGPLDKQITLMTDQQLVEAAARNLSITFASGDRASAVTQTLGLPRRGQGDTAVSWKSSHPGVVSAYGGVYPAKTDTPVTLTATVTKNAAAATRTFQVTVLKEQETAAPGAGGVDDPQKREPLPPGQLPSPINFTDLDSVPWARESILALAEAGVISGTSATTFSPANPIKRGDFIALLMRMLQPAGEMGPGFDDVPPTSYYYREITQAQGLGIAAGAGNNQFRPEDSISRQDMMVLTYRALLLTGVLEDAASEASVLERFRDAQMISAYAVAGVARVVEEGMISGDTAGRIQPLQNTTRAETAVFLYRVYQRIYG